MNAERRFDWGAWLTLAIAATWVIGGLAMALVTLQLPSDGWVSYGPDSATGTFEFEMNLTGAPSVLQSGDVLLAINGQALSVERGPRFPPDLHAGQTLRYTVERGGQALDLDVPVIEVGPAGLVRSIAQRWQRAPRDFLVATLSFLVVALAFSLRPGNLGARYLLLIFSFYCFSSWVGPSFSSVMYYTHPVPLDMARALSGHLVWGWYFFPSLTLMALAFPVVQYPLRRFPRLLPALLYGAPLALSLVSAYAVRVTGNYRWNQIVTPVFAPVALLTIAAIFGSLLHNWRTLREPVARAQLRWLTLGLGAGLGLMFVLMFVALGLYGEVPLSWNDILWLPILLPISMAIAITRYRLFDIDIIIRRTLVYSVLTALLALAYFGSVLVLQSVFRALTGEAQSPLITVLSTLAIAGLSLPLRARVQAFIDRRFYRRKVDAARTLAEFAATARDETDLARLTAQLAGVVQETMQPEHIGVWLASPGKGRGAP